MLHDVFKLSHVVIEMRNMLTQSLCYISCAKGGPQQSSNNHINFIDGQDWGNQGNWNCCLFRWPLREAVGDSYHIANAAELRVIFLRLPPPLGSKVKRSCDPLPCLRSITWNYWLLYPTARFQRDWSDVYLVSAVPSDIWIRSYSFMTLPMDLFICQKRKETMANFLHFFSFKIIFLVYFFIFY